MANVVFIKSSPSTSRANQNREKILAAFISLVNEIGFQATTARRIAEHAGVSVGAVQQCFQNNTVKLEALVELSYQLYLELMSSPELLQGSLKERVSLFVTFTWRHYQSDVYQAMLETLIATRTERDFNSLAVMSELQTRNVHELFRRIFNRIEIDERELGEVLVTIHSQLAGLALMRIMSPKLVNIGGYLRRASRLLLSLIER